MKKTTSVTYALISGLILGCAYPPVGLGFLAYICLVPMLFVITGLKPRRVLLLSFLSGLIFHVITVSWIRHITWIGMIAGILYLALFYSIPFFIASLSSKIFPRMGIIIFPFAVAGIEWVKSFDLLAFPWMILGNSQTYYPWLIQFADITSAFGVSWWVAMVNVSIFFLIKKRTAVRWGFFVLLFLIPLLYSWNVMHSPVENNKEIKVSLIQGNVYPDEKWGRGNVQWNINLYRNMSIEAMSYKPDLIIWPETAIPVYLCESPKYRYLIHSFVDSIGVPIITGMPSIDFETDRTWNSAGFFKPGEKKVQRYDKIHLVPFGEAIPLDDYFPSLKKLDLGQANWSKGKETVVFKSPVLPPFNVVICFESIFPDLVRKFVVKGIQFIIVITNDVWFGPYSSPIQHAMISVFRAIEFHLPVVRCANTGISMIIDPYGRVVDKTGTFERTILTGTISPRTNKTFYAQFGNIFSIFCLIITCFVLIFYYVMNYYKFKRTL
ncbi:MAG TPA: apolipoprotein N-acyltransferase [bacterium]|nr:apolipoprotein N-acyltransferase [bacterium]